ncbi:MAG TPA: YceI family protein [Solirubrobacteraceae bacterium]|jgi:polyisoprenoid-binding protein YceI
MPVTLLPPGLWEVDAERSVVGFDVRHLKIARVRGRFHVVSAQIGCDREGVAYVSARVDVASIDTGDIKRDERICAADFFDVEHHPTMSYTGRVAPAEDGAPLTASGTMTMRGVTRELELDAEPWLQGEDGEAWVRARGSLSRSDFGLEWDSAFAAGGLVIDDHVALRLKICLTPAADTA